MPELSFNGKGPLLGYFFPCLFSMAACMAGLYAGQAGSPEREKASEVPGPKKQGIAAFRDERSQDWMEKVPDFLTEIPAPAEPLSCAKALAYFNEHSSIKAALENYSIKKASGIPIPEGWRNCDGPKAAAFITSCLRHDPEHRPPHQEIITLRSARQTLAGPSQARLVLRDGWILIEPAPEIIQQENFPLWENQVCSYTYRLPEGATVAQVDGWLRELAFLDKKSPGNTPAANYAALLVLPGRFLALTHETLECPSTIDRLLGDLVRKKNREKGSLHD